MIGQLPTTLTVGNIEYPIRTDYRNCLNVLTAFSDPDLSDTEKVVILLTVIYKEIPPEELTQEAYDKAIWFLNCGNTIDSPVTNSPLYNWEQDESIIFSSINKVAGKEVRAIEHMHFWTFMGLFNEIGEGTFSTVVSIRDKKKKHKKLEKWEQDFYRHNKDMVDLKVVLSSEDKAEQSEVDKLLGIKRGE